MSYFFFRGVFTLLVCILFSTLSGIQAARQDAKLAPPPFYIAAGNSNPAVFVDIQRARHSILYNVSQKKTLVQSEIVFDQFQDGYPIIDLVSEPDAVALDGQPIKTRTIKAPQNATEVRILEQVATAGRHVVVMRHQLANDTVEFIKGGVRSAVWYHDLKDRHFLEMFLPTNLEFDMYEMQVLVTIEGADDPHILFTNANLKVVGEHQWALTYNRPVNSSTLFFHLGPVDDFEIRRANFPSKRGKDLPVVVYGKKANDFQLNTYLSLALETLKELERDYGAFPHPAVIIYAAPEFPGGMEYPGGTITNSWALPHELTHSYFGRGIMPSSGNSGWLDEAIASWRDNHYPRLDEPGYDSANLAARSPYQRWTPEEAYREGMRFMGYLDHVMTSEKEGKGLKVFLNQMLKSHLFQPLSTPIFQAEVDRYLGRSLAEDFSQYVYGRSQHSFMNGEKSPVKPSPFHQKIDWVRLKKFL